MAKADGFRRQRGISAPLARAHCLNGAEGSAVITPVSGLSARVGKACGGLGPRARVSVSAMIPEHVNARIDRKRRKRDFRRLWILRVNAACRQRGVRYSQFIDGCKKARIELNRKMLSEIAIADPAAFDAVVEKAQAALA